MGNRTPKEIIDDTLYSYRCREMNKSKSICDNCDISGTCKYHNRHKDKVVKDCPKFEMRGEVYEEVADELKRQGISGNTFRKAIFERRMKELWQANIQC